MRKQRQRGEMSSQCHPAQVAVAPLQTETAPHISHHSIILSGQESMPPPDLFVHTLRVVYWRESGLWNQKTWKSQLHHWPRDWDFWFLNHWDLSSATRVTEKIEWNLCHWPTHTCNQGFSLLVTGIAQELQGKLTPVPAAVPRMCSIILRETPLPSSKWIAHKTGLKPICSGHSPSHSDWLKRRHVTQFGLMKGRDRSSLVDSGELAFPPLCIVQRKVKLLSSLPAERADTW